ncbi:MAG: 4Fe-4S dicluster domain-containing protein [Bacteroidales bacterium]|nr:4Fe-4S dicluster domain-containing protein [Bacteroidales bacterium]
MEENNNSRRDFLKKLGIVVGVGAVATAGAVYVGYDYEKKKNPAGKMVKVLTADGKLMEVPEEDLIQAEMEAETQLTALTNRGREGIAGKSWVMVIDLSKCRNARMCMAACQGAHQLRPEQHHINVLRMQDTEKTAPYFMPKPCYHCDNPPCVKVCPVDATFKRQDGIVLIDNERCIGCRFCIAGCPYSARIFQWFEPRDVEKYADKEYDIELNVPQKKGTISKCLFSADRCREGELPYCVSACPNGVYYFGDMNEDVVVNGTTKEAMRFSELIRKNAGYTVHEELGTKPRVYYLPPKNRLFDYVPENPEQGEQNDTHHG